MSTDTEAGGGVDPAGEAPVPEPAKPRFALPSAYTILFGLIVIVALATWIIPAGQYALDADGSPIPGTYQEVESTPSRIIVDSLEAPINGMYGIEDPATGNVDVFNRGHLFGAIDVALFIIVIGGFLAVFGLAFVAIPSVAFPGYPPEPVNQMASAALRLFREAGSGGSIPLRRPCSRSPRTPSSSSGAPRTWSRERRGLSSAKTSRSMPKSPGTDDAGVL